MSVIESDGFRPMTVIDILPSWYPGYRTFLGPGHNKHFVIGILTFYALNSVNHQWISNENTMENYAYVCWSDTMYL